MTNLRLQPGLSRSVSLAMVGAQSSLLGAESLLDQCCYCRDAMASASLPNGVWSAPGAKCPQRWAKMPSPAPAQEVEERLLVLGQSSGEGSVVRSQRQRWEPESRLALMLMLILMLVLMLMLTLKLMARKTGERWRQKRMQEQRRRQSQSNLRRRRPRSALRRREGARMPEDRKKELASKSLVAARQASNEDQDLRFTDSGVYGEGVEPCQDTRVADGSRPTMAVWDLSRRDRDGPTSEGG